MVLAYNISDMTPFGIVWKQRLAESPLLLDVFSLVDSMPVLKFFISFLARLGDMLRA